LNTEGDRVIGFIEKFCRITRGARRGDRIELREWQKDIVRNIYRLDDTRKRVYRRGLLGMPRKNGKSLLGAGIALYELIMGEPGAEVYSVAGDRDQARIVFNEVMQMIRLDPDLRAPGVCVIRDAQAMILYPADGSSYRAIAADSATAEGLNPSAVIFDELHVQTNSKLWAVMVNGSAARERALILGITTAGFDLDTICGKLYKLGMSGTAPNFYFHWIEPAKNDCDWLDEKVWREANLGLGDFLSLADFRDSAAEAAVRGAESEFRRYRLNQWTDSIEAWLPYGAWSKLSTPGTPLIEGEAVVLGFDGSFSGDSTGIVACTTGRDAPYIQTVAAWERPEGGEGWRIDIAAVEARVIELCKTYAVQEVACDPFRWQRSMQVLEDAGIPIVEYPTSSPARMVRSTTIFADYVHEGRLSHNGDPALARHLANVRIKTDAKGPRVVKGQTNAHIDLAVAAIIALERALARVEDDNAFTGDIW
jgi:phage terminase large subunit-like protein